MQFNRKKPIITYGLIGICVVVFAAEWLLGATRNTQMLVWMGAKEVVRITSGEWWRLISCTFLHGSVAHLLSNMLAIYIWGRYAEALMGRMRFLAVYMLSGIAGSILSYAFSTHVSVGASGAIFGLFGGFLFLLVWDRELFNAILGRQVVVLVAINLVTSVTMPNIDLWGHLGGLVGGFLAAGAIGVYGRRKFSLLHIGGGVLFLLIFGGLLFYAYQKYAALLWA